MSRLFNFSRVGKDRLTVGVVSAYVILLILTAICLFPILNVVAYSFSGTRPVLSGEVTFYPIDFNLLSYKEILKYDQIWQSMKISLIVTISGACLSLVLTTMAAYVLSREDFPGKKFFNGFILLTMYVYGGIIPTFLVVKGLGMYDTLYALFIPTAVSVYNFILMRTFFRQIPSELIHSAMIDGANDLVILIRIILPLSIPIIATMVLFYAVQYWNDYFNSLIYITNPDKYTLQLRLRNILFADELANAGANTEGLGTQVMTQSLKMACISVGTIPIVMIYPFIQKYFVTGMMAGSIKG